MKLQMDFVDIKDIQFGPKTIVKENVLYIDKEEAEAFILEDDRIAACSIDITRPGDKTRIVCIQDIVEPRCKVEPEGTDFPGYVGKIQRVGYGVTRALRNTAIMVCSPNPGGKGYFSYFNYMDTGGQVASISKYGNMPLVVLTPQRADSVLDLWDWEYVFKRAAYRLAVFLAKHGVDHPVAETRHYDLELNGQDTLYPGLPRVGYYFLPYTPQYDRDGISEPIFYGGEIGITLPTIVHPNEILDGCMTVDLPIRGICTYDCQNHGMINEMYKRHGKDLNFVGMVMGVSHENAEQRDRRAVLAASLMQDVLRAEGCVLTKVSGGMMHMDLARISIEMEDRGVRTVPCQQGLAHLGSLADVNLFKHPKIDAIVYYGATFEGLTNNYHPERLLGGPPETMFAFPGGDTTRAVRVDATDFWTEEYLMAGVHDFTGGCMIKSADR